jgi:hypothetical protein
MFGLIYGIQLTMFSYIGAIFIQDSVFAGFILPPTDLILTSSYARRTFVGSKRFNCLWVT